MKFKTFFRPDIVLKSAGYQKAKRGYVRWIGKNRYHAIVIGYNEIDLHIDKVFFEHGESWHSAAPKDFVKGEVKRIRMFD
jgi:hypothetical protein